MQHFREPKNLLPYSEKRGTELYPEPAESLSHPYNLLIYNSVLYYPQIHAEIYQVTSFIRVFRIKLYVHFSSPPCHVSFRSHYGPGVDSASNRNEYQEYLMEVKAAGA